MSSFRRFDATLGALFAIPPATRHDRCVIKRTRNGLRIKLRRFSHIGQFVEQDQMRVDEVGRRTRERKVLLSTFEARLVGINLNSKFGHSRFVGSLDQLLATSLSRNLTTDCKVRYRADRSATYGAGRGGHSYKYSDFHARFPFDEAALRRKFPLETARVLADVYFPPRRSAFDGVLRFFRGVFRRVGGNRGLARAPQPRKEVV
ncbi:hypothetical protein AB3X91_11885 [Paraburkholderia sp. BR14263]|uniref:hypothetical protein n=1 Tax=unclassified Paraburkholderia TaxID=2615204 RepID=UPI0034CE154C